MLTTAMMMIPALPTELLMGVAAGLGGVLMYLQRQQGQGSPQKFCACQACTVWRRTMAH